MSQTVPLLAASSIDYGTHSSSRINERFQDLSLAVRQKKHKDLALFVGKVLLIAIVIGALVAASVFSGGLAAVGAGVGIAFLKCFAFSAITLATGGFAGMLFLGTAFKVASKIRGVSEKETDAKLSKIYHMSSITIASASLLLSLAGIPVLLVGFMAYKIMTAPEVNTTNELPAKPSRITPRRHGPTFPHPLVLLSSDVAMDRISETLAVAPTPSVQQATPSQKKLDLLVSLTYYSDLSKIKDQLSECGDFRDKVYFEVWSLSGKPDDKTGRWGELHAFDDAGKLRRAIKSAYRLHPNSL